MTVIDKYPAALDDQVKHEHSQFMRLVAKWDTLSARAKEWLRIRATEYPSWLDEIDALERSRLTAIMKSASNALKPLKPLEINEQERTQ